MMYLVLSGDECGINLLDYQGKIPFITGKSAAEKEFKKLSDENMQAVMFKIASDGLVLVKHYENGN